MKKSYFMIRFPDNSLNGPLSYRRLTSAIISQKVTLDAEISGDLGPWVFLNRESDLKLHYPQLYEVMNQHSLISHQSKWLTRIKGVFRVAAK